jgi:N-acyl-D-amino-acid deacylase
MLERFKDPALRKKIIAEAEQAMTARFGGPQGVYMPALNRELTDVMKELSVSGGEALVSVLEKDNTGAILRFGIEEDLVKILQHPTTSIACDCGATPPDRAAHPRYYGTFPRVLGRYVRETKALTWPDAIRKMTLLPAATIGLVDRGAIAAGLAADITVFDPNSVIDYATFEQPTLKSVGIRHVIVNGAHALHDGAVTGHQGGQALLRTKQMPSRALDVSRPRRVIANTGGSMRGQKIHIALSQKPAERKATGTLTLMASDVSPALSVELVELGLLQVADSWASVSARVRTSPETQDRAMVAIIEGADPWEPGRVPSITLVFDSDFSKPLRLLPRAGSVRVQ